MSLQRGWLRCAGNSPQSATRTARPQLRTSCRSHSSGSTLVSPSPTNRPGCLLYGSARQRGPNKDYFTPPAIKDRLRRTHHYLVMSYRPRPGGVNEQSTGLFFISRRQIGDRGGCNGRWSAIARHGRSPGRVRARSRARRRRPPTAGSWRCAVRRKYESPSRNRECPVIRLSALRRAT